MIDQDRHNFVASPNRTYVIVYGCRTGDVLTTDEAQSTMDRLKGKGKEQRCLFSVPATYKMPPKQDLLDITHYSGIFGLRPNVVARLLTVRAEWSRK